MQSNDDDGADTAWGASSPLLLPGRSQGESSRPGQDQNPSLHYGQVK